MTYSEAVRQIELENLKVDEANALMSQLIQELDHQKHQENLAEIDERLRQFSDLYDAVVARAEQFPSDLEWQLTKRRAVEFGIMFRVGDTRRRLLAQPQPVQSAPQPETQATLNTGWDTDVVASASEADVR